MTHSMRPSIRLLLLVVVTVGVALCLTCASISSAQEPRPEQSVSTPANNGLPKVTGKTTYKLTPSELSTPAAALIYHDAPTAVAWSSDGKKLAAFSDYGKRINVWDINTKNVTILNTSMGYAPYVDTSIEFLVNDTLLAPPEMHETPRDDHLGFSIWSLQGGAAVQNVEGPFPTKGWRDNFTEVYTVSPDKHMAAGIPLAPLAGTVTIYSTNPWHVLHNLPSGAAFSVAFSPDSTQLAVGGTRYSHESNGSYTTAIVTIFDASTGQTVKTLPVFDKGTHVAIRSLAYSPDGLFIVVGGTLYSTQHNVKPVRVFRVSDGALVAAFADDAVVSDATVSIRKVLWNPKYNWIAFSSGGDGTVRLWNPANPADLGTTVISNPATMCLAFSPDGDRLASCDTNGITVFDLAP